jgi:hypothetical protein
MYNDANANGRLDEGEAEIAATTTDENGVYTFPEVMLTHVIIEVVVPEDRATETFTATVDTQEAITMSNLDIIDVNFGIDKVQLTNYTISGTVFDDDNVNGIKDVEEGVLANVILTLYADNDTNGRVGSEDTVIATTTTASDGTYSFTEVTFENTFVVVTLPTDTASYTYVLSTTGSVNTNSVTEDVLDIDFGINKESNSYEVSGNVFNDENADGANAITESGLRNVTVSLYNDANANGRIDRGESLITSMLSDRNGNYQFIGITEPNVIAQVIVPSNTSQFTYVSTTSVNVAITGSNTVTVDFGIFRQVVILHDISGVVWDDQNSDQLKDTTESRLEGISVTLYEDVNTNGVLDVTDRSLSTILTSTNGTYQFSNVNLRNVLVVPTLPSNGTFTTSTNRAISSINTDALDVDFGINIGQTLYQVIGVVFDDQNENGILDDGEESIDGLPVEIYADTDGSGTYDPNLDLLVAFTQTSNGGFGFLNPNYLVDDIPPGQVFIVVLIPEDTIFTTYTPTFDPDSGTSAPDGVYPTVMTTNLTNINFGLKVTQVNATSRTATTSTGMITNETSVTVAPEDISERLRLYPNPTVKEIAINTDEFAGEVTVEIYSERGYKVLTTTVTPFGGEIKVNVQRLAPGMYYAKFGSRNKVASKKFLKR